MQRIICTLAFIILVQFSWAQKYFQQNVNYLIEVKLDDRIHLLDGTLILEYINNSPDTLNFIWFHLWPNAYKDNSTALVKQMNENGNHKLYFADEEDRGYMEVNEFVSSGKICQLKNHEAYIDVVKVLLPEPLFPGKKTNISTTFKVKIPSGKFSRLGHIGESYQITQWYPKPAVYDWDGWHEMPYLNQGEFYSEFGAYDVSITLPKNYKVAASGQLTTESERQWLLENLADTSVKYTDDLSFPASSDQFKTVDYHISNAHDFAWFADKRYHVLHDQMELPHSKRKIDTWAFFTNNEADLWKKSLEYIKDGIYYYSLWIGDYSYQNVTAVDGTISAGSGMEYPTITVIGNSGNAKRLEEVIVHEVGHNWFYSILGNNERKHPWLDEGINSFYEMRYFESKYGRGVPVYMDSIHLGLIKIPAIDIRKGNELGYLFSATRNNDQAIESHSADYTALNYGVIVYSKTALCFNYLKHYLGDHAFDQCMQNYFESWKFKHPGPADLEQSFKTVAQSDLSWFFDDLIEDNKKLDFSFGKVDLFNKKVEVFSKNNFTGPVSLYGIKDENVIWIKSTGPFQHSTLLEIPDANLDFLILDANGEIPEVNRNNNVWANRKLFKKKNPISINYFTGIDEPGKQKLYVMPLAGWNDNDHFMLGGLITNQNLFEKPFTYRLSPLYSFSQKTLNGYYQTQVNLTPQNSLVKKIELAYSGAKFSLPGYLNENIYFFRNRGDITLKIKPENPRRIHSNEWKLSVINSKIAIGEISLNGPSQNIYSLFRNWSHRAGITSTSFVFGADISDEFKRISLELQRSYVISKENDEISFRFFFGQHFNSDFDQIGPQWNMSGVTSLQDIKFENVFLGRGANEGFLSQQFIPGQGGFKAPFNGGRTNKHLLAANLSLDLPFHIPIALFADAGIVRQSMTNGISGEKSEDDNFLYDAGLSLVPLKGILEVHFPLFYSESIKDEYDTNEIDFGERIRFTLRLDKLSPFKLMDLIPQ